MAFNLLKIKGLISQHNLSQKEFADKIGVTRQTVINYFNERARKKGLELKTKDNLHEKLKELI